MNEFINTLSYTLFIYMLETGRTTGLKSRLSTFYTAYPHTNRHYSLAKIGIIFEFPNIFKKKLRFKGKKIDFTAFCRQK